MDTVKIKKCWANKDTVPVTAVKDEKDRCLGAFGICKKAEDAAVGLIHTCIKGEVKTLTADGRLE